MDKIKTLSKLSRLDMLNDTSEIIRWTRQQQCIIEIWNGKPTKRLEKWFGLGVQLLNYGTSLKTYHAQLIESEPLLKSLCVSAAAPQEHRYYPSANSVLLYKYEVGTGINVHQDKPVFNERVVLINLVDAEPDLFGQKPSIKFKYADETLTLADGEVIEFNAKIPHGIPPVSVERYSISLRVIS